MKCLSCPGEDLWLDAGNVFGPGTASEGGEMSDRHQQRHLCPESQHLQLIPCGCCE